MFNDCDENTNGERWFFERIKSFITTIFDVGCRHDSIFINFTGEVHYFEPMTEFIEKLQTHPTQNTKSFYNTFGLSNTEESIYYYPAYQSFYDRIESCKQSDDKNKIILRVKRADDYMRDNNIKAVDFLKIDTEGYELNVIQGFGDKIKNVNCIQFEYGGTFLDNKIKLIDVINYLRDMGFFKFSYLAGNTLVEMTDFTDHYQYCNIVCFNREAPFVI